MKTLIRLCASPGALGLVLVVATSAAAQVPVPIRPPEPNGPTITGTRYLVVEGHVRDAATGTPIGGATLHVRGAGRELANATSDRLGQYRVAVNLPDSAGSIVIDAARPPMYWRVLSSAIRIAPGGPDSVTADVALEDPALTPPRYSDPTGRRWVDQTLSQHFDSIRVEYNLGAWSGGRTIRTTLFPTGRATMDTANLLHPSGGPYLSHVDLRDYNRLAAMLDTLGFMRLSPSYSAGITDASTITITVCQDGVVKTVSDYADNGPLALWEIEQAIAHVVSTIRW